MGEGHKGVGGGVVSGAWKWKLLPRRYSDNRASSHAVAFPDFGLQSQYPQPLHTALVCRYPARVADEAYFGCIICRLRGWQAFRNRRSESDQSGDVGAIVPVTRNVKMPSPRPSLPLYTAPVRHHNS